MSSYNLTPGHTTHQEERRQNRAIDHGDLMDELGLMAQVQYKFQGILSREGVPLSQEILLDAPLAEIEYLLFDQERSFQLFLRAFAEGLYQAQFGLIPSHVNIDIVNLRHPNFKKSVSAILARFRRKVERRKIEIEITERGAIQDVYDPIVGANLEFLKRLGFILHSDDFDPLQKIEGSISRYVLAKFGGIISGVKLPHEYQDILLVPSLERDLVMRSIPPTKRIIGEGSRLKNYVHMLHPRVKAIQSPLN